MRVYVLSKSKFDSEMKKRGVTNDNVESYTNTFFISINNTFDSNLSYFENKMNVKVLFFDDVEKDTEYPIIGTKEVRLAKAFTTAQAKELLEFINNHKTKETCIVHCAAGISRSGAVGTFINEYLYGDQLEFERNNPQIQPNLLVLKKLRDLVNNH